MRYYVYLLLCSDGSFYVGVTSNLEQRIGRHDTGWDLKCYTFSRRPLKLVYAADFQRIEQAIAWEKHVKGWSRAKKRALIANDWKAMHALAACGNATAHFNFSRQAVDGVLPARRRDSDNECGA
ncbi:MAG TPA: GIY-YIG nuclease family protein [Candidatus Cybelea sp.]|jgi:putative endonuclease|nr:GIY-YIG nuclease family protein [Candidatus Cybelea sp.]